MKKKIEITNESTFNRGIKTYVHFCDAYAMKYHIHPDIIGAKQYDADSPELNLDLYFIKQHLKKATVKAINV